MDEYSHIDALLAAPTESLSNFRSTFATKPVLSSTKPSPPTPPEGVPLRPAYYEQPKDANSAVSDNLPPLPAPSHALPSLPPSVDELLQQWKADLAASGDDIHQKQALGERTSPCTSKSVWQTSSLEDYDDIESRVEILEEGKTSGRLFATEQQPPQLLSDNFVDGDDDDDIHDNEADESILGTSHHRYLDNSETEDEGSGITSNRPIGVILSAPKLPRSERRRPREMELQQEDPFIRNPSIGTRLENLNMGAASSRDDEVRKKLMLYGDDSSRNRDNGEQREFGQEEEEEGEDNKYSGGVNADLGLSNDSTAASENDLPPASKSAVVNASNIDLAFTSSTPAVWEEPLEPFELDPQFDYENCPQTPRFDTDIGRVAEEYARRKSAAMENGASVDLAGLF